MKNLLLLMCCFSMGVSGFTQNRIQYKTDEGKKRIDVMHKGRLLTSYRYEDSMMKPVLFPLNTVSGITVTRGYPLEPRKGERTDHPHHVGLWLNYESVNGIDFWNNSTSIAAEKKLHYGRIVHLSARIINETLQTEAAWRTYDGKQFLKESTVYRFEVKGNDVIIDRKTMLTASDSDVIFKDVKDGMLAIRVARELEQPSKEPSDFVDDKGNITRVDPSNGNVTGNYINAEGIQGDAVWSTKGPWCMLQGNKDGKDIVIAMIDHPENPGFPSYWHARGYGLFAMNPLGRNIFSKGADQLNLTLKKGENITFIHRVIIHEGSTYSVEEMKKLATAFGAKSF